MSKYLEDERKFRKARLTKLSGLLTGIIIGVIIGIYILEKIVG